MKTVNNLKNIITTIVIVLTASTTQAQVNIEKAIAATNTQWLGTKEITSTQVQVSVTNKNNQLVEVEYSFDNVHFTIAYATETVTNEKNNVAVFTHQSQDLTGKKLAFYRVKMVDNFGTVTYSNATTVGLEG